MAETETERDAAVAPDAAVEPDAAPSRGWTRGLLIAAVVLVIAGVAPQRLGCGWFGTRAVLADNVTVHVLNLTDADVVIAAPFGSPQTVASGALVGVETLAGPLRIRATRTDGTLVEDVRVDATGAVFYNVGGGRCFAVFDISEFYGAESEQPELRVVARLDEATRTYAFDADTVVLPRRPPPDMARGRVHWLEPVGCTLLDPEEESYLVGRNLHRMQERRERREEEMRQAREAAGQ